LLIYTVTFLGQSEVCYTTDKTKDAEISYPSIFLNSIDTKKWYFIRGAKIKKKKDSGVQYLSGVSLKWYNAIWKPCHN
jgi:hypothetical protein